MKTPSQTLPVPCSDGLSVRQTVLSPCRLYRYTLWRQWGIGALPLLQLNQGPDSYAMFIGLNPSTADETKDDPTIRKCIGFAKRWGYGALLMTNLFAFRATNPIDMMAQERAVGPDNLAWLARCAKGAGTIVAAWGTKGSFRNQDLVVEYYIRHISNRSMMCLRKTKNGCPEHPLYVPYETVPEAYQLRTDKNDSATPVA